METRKIKDLKPHPANEYLYGVTIAEQKKDFDLLVDSIKKVGILTPLLVTNDDVVISGHRRLQAAEKAGVEEVPVNVLEFTDEHDIEEALILANRQRQKNRIQIAREFTKLKEIEKERAKKRMLSGKNPPQNSAEGQAAENDPMENSAEGQIAEKNPPQNSAEGQKKGDARKIAAEKLGISHDTAEKAVKVVHKIDELRAAGKEEEAVALGEKLEKSVNAAYKEVVKPGKKDKKPREEDPMENFPQGNAPVIKQRIDWSDLEEPPAPDENCASCQHLLQEIDGLQHEVAFLNNKIAYLKRELTKYEFPDEDEDENKYADAGEEEYEEIRFGSKTIRAKREV